MSFSPVVVPRVAPNERLYAIGDIHGRVDLLIRLLERIEEDGARFHDDRVIRLVFLGDYVDRGDDSRAVLEVLSDLARTGGTDMFLMGNHEATLLEFLDTPSIGPRWFSFGGLQTLASYGVRPPRGDDEASLHRTRDAFAEALGAHRKFLETLQLYAQSGDVLFAHAGVNPDRPDPLEDRDALLRGCGQFLAANPVPGRRIVHGHFDSETPVSLPGRICVDTGAYFTGRLTAVRLDEGEEFLSVS